MNKISIRPHTGYLYRLLDSRSGSQLPIWACPEDADIQNGSSAVSLSWTFALGNQRRCKLLQEKDARLNNKMVLSLRSMPPPSPATKGMTMPSAGSSVTQLHWCRAVARTIYTDGHTQHASKENSILQHAYKKIHKDVHVFTYRCSAYGATEHATRVQEMCALKKRCYDHIHAGQGGVTSGSEINMAKINRHD